ncbi:Fe(3+) ABC transporter substrate-binding protein [Marinicella sp. S1101]|uniref:Fe(3+) ABC transporter substrate-binding protein n=1 Tax=Marinicella marina TaxID=2996016 RepID=UPI002260E3F5|nr:Fe(3+) ABC transporter substrate-binding protein [Marinicella marina]MCX7553003.1 Fe(3+) ABC transporter substrate-binding protein [Marinicella marina]MDJ1139687.1 Fe(3+) ABC transporter substrate-binding protein [Marinicella marina]
MQSLRLFKSVLFIVAAGLILTGCAQVADPEVNVYSSRKEALIKPALDKFTAATGIKVNLVTGKDDALIERLKAEGAASPADVLITVDAGRLYRAKSFGLTQAIDSPSLQNAIPAAFRDPENHWFGLSLRARPIMYAKDRVNPSELESYASLTTDKWLGKVCIRSSGNIYNQSLVASMVASMGTAAVESWAKGLVKNFARKPVGGDRDQIKAIAAGQCDVAIANTYYLFGMLQSDDPEQVAAAEQIGVFWPNQNDRGTHVNVSGIAVTQAAKNKDHAQQLLEFLAQDETQSWYANVNGEYPVKDNIEAHPLLVEWGQFKKDALNLAKLGELNSEAVKIMDRAGWP